MLYLTFTNLLESVNKASYRGVKLLPLSPANEVHVWAINRPKTTPTLHHNYATFRLAVTS